MKNLRAAAVLLGTILFAIQAFAQQSATSTLTLTVAPAAAVTITTTSLPAGIAGTAYSQTIAVSGGVAPLTCTAGGTLPGGLHLNGCTISGTPSGAGTSTFLITAADSQSPPQTATQSLTISIIAQLAIVTASLPGGQINIPYPATTLAASGGVAPYSWSAHGLPAGLVISTAGVISGTPTTAGTSTVSVTVKDSSGAMARRKIAHTPPAKH